MNLSSITPLLREPVRATAERRPRSVVGSARPSRLKWMARPPSARHTCLNSGVRSSTGRGPGLHGRPHSARGPARRCGNWSIPVPHSHTTSKPHHGGPGGTRNSSIPGGTMCGQGHYGQGGMPRFTTSFRWHSCSRPVPVKAKMATWEDQSIRAPRRQPPYSKQGEINEYRPILRVVRHPNLGPGQVRDARRINAQKPLQGARPQAHGQPLP